MRKKITYQIILSVIALIIAVRLLMNVTNTVSDFTDYYHGKEDHLQQVSELIGDQDKKNAKSYEEIFNFLEVARLSNLIDFYQIEEQGAVKFKTSNVGELDTKIQTDPRVMRAGNLSFVKLKLNKFETNIGFFGHNKYAYWEYLKRDFSFILLDLILLAFVVAGTIRYRLQILTSISRVLSQLTPRDLDNISHPSLEIRTIVNFLRSFIDEHFKSEQQRNLFKRNLADGILNELFSSRKKPPYPIQVVLVRFDMNNYSRRALQENTEQFTALLSRYFRKVKELRIRYGGLDYQFIGDEKVLFFKVDNPDQLEQQILRSVAFLRDTFNLAKDMSKEYPLTFKAAVVPGTLLFYELDGGHYFTGSPLIETARYLTTISEKDRSILTLPTVQNEKIKKLAKPYASESVLLKGYDTPLGISYFDRFDNIYALEKEATLFLSDQGLVQILEFLSKALAEKNADRFFQIFQQIRGVRAEEVDPDVASHFEKFLDLVIEKYKTVEIDNKCLSCAIALCWVFVPVGSETGHLKDLFYSLIRHKDIRVASNALIASQRYEWNEDIIDKMLNSPSNRLRGDALVLLGRRGVDQKFYKAWKDLVENSDGSFVLSGLYASQEVFKFHVENNPTHLKSNPLVETMVQNIEKLTKSSKPNVVQRAQWALDVIKNS